MISIEEAYEIFLQIKPNHYLDKAEYTKEWFRFHFGPGILLSWAGSYIPPDNEPMSILINKKNGSIRHLNYSEDNDFFSDHTAIWMDDDSIFTPEDLIEFINLDDLNKRIIKNMPKEELKLVKRGNYGDYMKRLYREIRRN